MKHRNSILINGYFLCRRLTGIERYAIEITKRLDIISMPGEVSIIIPSNCKNVPNYKNITIILYKKIIPHILWQMVFLQIFLFNNKKYTILDFSNICLPFFPGIIFLHDIYCEYFPEDFSGFKENIIRIYNRLQYRLISKKAKKIITVSNFTRNQISENFNVNRKKITVIYSSWEHYKNIIADYTIFDDYSNLIKGNYFFLMGSLSKRKNLKWIIEYAKKYSESIFVISGISLNVVKVKELNKSIPNNILMPGYLEDTKVKALMENCKAFILPSYYEGFGLTPLEALSCGAQIIVSNSSSLPEIFGNTAHYINPFDTNINLDELLLLPVDKPDDILNKYSYNKAAEQVYKIIQDFKNDN